MSLFVLQSGCGHVQRNNSVVEFEYPYFPKRFSEYKADELHVNYGDKRIIYQTGSDLIPCKSTFVVAERTAELCREIVEERGMLKVLDIGTGNAVILLVIAEQCRSDLDSLKLDGVDINPECLIRAYGNAKLNDIDSKCAFNLSDCLNNVHGPYDVIVSNPPFFTTSMAQSSNIGPDLAINGGEDGMAMYVKILRQAPEHLSSSGKLV